MLEVGRQSIAVMKYESDLRGPSKIKTPMKGHAAVASGYYGHGRVVLVSAHPENEKSPKEAHELIVRLFQYAGGKL